MSPAPAACQPAEAAEPLPLLSELLYQLQAEAAGSCAHVASQGSSSELGAKVATFRKNVDGLLEGHRECELQGVANEIQSIRQSIDASTSAQANPNVGGTFRNTLATYAEICSQIMRHESDCLEKHFGLSPLTKTKLHVQAIKDSFCRIRCWLVGISHLPHEIVSRLPHAKLDILVCARKHKELQAKLQQDVTADLVELVVPCFEVQSPEFAQIHWKLQSEFSMEELKGNLSKVDIWEVYSAQIDKLHAVEGLLDQQMKVMPRWDREAFIQAREAVTQAVTFFSQPWLLRSDGAPNGTHQENALEQQAFVDGGERDATAFQGPDNIAALLHKMPAELLKLVFINMLSGCARDPRPACLAKPSLGKPS